METLLHLNAFSMLNIENINENIRNYPKPLFTFDINDPNLSIENKLYAYKVNRAHDLLINSKNNFEATSYMYNFLSVREGNLLKYSPETIFSLYEEKKYDFLISNLKNSPEHLDNDHFTVKIIFHLYHLGLPLEVIKLTKKYNEFLKYNNDFINELKIELNNYLITNVINIVVKYLDITE
jgi:hypothetical protein